MDWTIDYLEEGGIVFVKMLNPINLKGTIQLCIEANLLARRQQSHRYLIDHRGVDIALSVLDIEEVPEKFGEVYADFDGKTAILLDPSAPRSDLFEFLTNVLSLESMEMKLFYDKDEAIAWLKLV